MAKKLQEMIMVVRPTKGDDMIPIEELKTILCSIGFDFLTDKTDEIANKLDSDGRGKFHSDTLVDYLVSSHTHQYTDVDALKKAVGVIGFDSDDDDDKVRFEEFEYLLNNFGDSENFYMDEAKIQLLLEACKPLDSEGNFNLRTFLENINSCWQDVVEGKD